jgi:hypothetical protein
VGVEVVIWLLLVSSVAGVRRDQSAGLLWTISGAGLASLWDLVKPELSRSPEAGDTLAGMTSDPHLALGTGSPDFPDDLIQTPAQTAPTALVGLSDVLAAYRTCELATVTRTGTPVNWPAVCWYHRDGGQIVLTTSFGAPR